MARERNDVETYMPLVIEKYLGDTQHLTTLQHGAYLLLLMAYWRRGGALPADDGRLASIAKMTPQEWKKARPVLAEFFEERDGAWWQKRAEQELERARKKSAAAAASARARWGNDASGDASAHANALRPDMREGCGDDAPPSSIQVEANASTIFPASRRKSPGTPLPSDWGPTDAHRQKAAALGVDCDFQAEKFKAWAEAKDARNVKWDRAFDNWLLNSKGHGNGGKQGQSGRGRAAEQWDARRRGAALSAGYRCGPDGVWYAPDGSVVGDPAGEGATPGH